jgi:hypothetical protein
MEPTSGEMKKAPSLVLWLGSEGTGPGSVGSVTPSELDGLLDQGDDDSTSVRPTVQRAIVAPACAPGALNPTPRGRSSQGHVTSRTPT